MLYCYWGKENRLLYRGLRYIEVRYIMVSLKLDDRAIYGLPHTWSITHITRLVPFYMTAYSATNPKLVLPPSSQSTSSQCKSFSLNQDYFAVLELLRGEVMNFSLVVRVNGNCWFILDVFLQLYSIKTCIFPIHAIFTFQFVFSFVQHVKFQNISIKRSSELIFRDFKGTVSRYCACTKI